METDTKTLQWQIPEALRYPFSPADILRKRLSLKKELLEQENLLPTRVAILGGSTTSELTKTLELFLLAQGLKPTFYQSGYNRYFEEVLFENPELWNFNPDVVFIHTTWHNISQFPELLEPETEVDQRVRSEVARFESLWEKIHKELGALIIQNNFDLPRARPLGNLEASESYCRLNYVLRLNAEFAAYARNHSRFLINDIHYLSAQVGLAAWHDYSYWHNFHMAVSPAASVTLAQNVAGIIKAAYGKTKKCLVLDLDNTLWGGVVGDDGVQNLVLGRDHPVGEAFLSFQHYVKGLKQRGVILAVCSKNDAENAKEGFSHPDSVLKLEDFSAFKANWNPKSENVRQIASELNIGLDSLVFVDDNPAERAIVREELPEVGVPEVGSDVSRFAEVLEQERYFEVAQVVHDDLSRSDYYASNAQRSVAEAEFLDYGAFLTSLEMTAEIGPFIPIYLERVTQLINKTNQFNLTTRRYTSGEVEAISGDPAYVTLYGRLADKFGDNGLVSVMIGHVSNETVEVDLWLMSCRVLNREFELAMFDAFVEECQSRGVDNIRGVYIPSKKNGMVAGLYGSLGFVREGVDPGDRHLWSYILPSEYAPKTRHIGRLEPVPAEPSGVRGARS
jgi:FkbH-like protein